MTFATRLFSFGPRVERRDGKLCARTGTGAALLMLGTSLKYFEADPAARTILFTRRRFWLFSRTWELRFEDVREVAYRYDNLAPFSSGGAADAIDHFWVLLELHSGEEIFLFHWIGPGEFTNNSNLPDWVFWDEMLFDAVGGQKNESMAFYEVLYKMVTSPDPALRTRSQAGAPKTVPILPPRAH